MSQCARSGSIEAIARSLELYGCINSGLHHVCRNSVISGCDQYFVTQAGDLVCVFSRRSIGRTRDATLFGEHLCETDGDTRTHNKHIGYLTETALRMRNAARLMETVATDWAAGSYGRNTGADAPALTSGKAEVLETTSRVVGRVDALSAALALPSAPALPDAAVQAGVAPPKKKLRYGMVLDEAETRDYTAVLAARTSVARAVRRVGTSAAAPETFVAIDGTDGIEALGASSPSVPALMSAEEHRLSLAATAASPDALVSSALVATEVDEARERQLAVSAARRALRAYVHPDTRNDIETVIEALFNARHRRTAMQPFVTEARASVRTSFARYAAHCNTAEVRPCLHALMQLHQAQADRIPAFRSPGGIDAVRLRAYSAVVYTLWDVCMNTDAFVARHTQFRFLDHIITVMYMLRDTLTLVSADGTEPSVVFERDPFLVERLPDFHRISAWDIPTRAPLSTIARVLSRTPMRKGYIDLSKVGFSAGKASLNAALQEFANEEDIRELTDRLHRARYTGIAV